MKWNNQKKISLISPQNEKVNENKDKMSHKSDMCDRDNDEVCCEMCVTIENSFTSIIKRFFIKFREQQKDLKSVQNLHQKN